MVRKGGLEPPCLSAPPPQDGVSANSTTSARCNYRALNILAISTRESNLAAGDSRCFLILHDWSERMSCLSRRRAGT